MGWLPSILDGGSDKPADPLGKLDPKLREFLEKESPVKHTPTQPEAAAAPQPAKNHDTKAIAQAEEAAAAAAAAAREPAVPSASLYQDGRYAHLWKTYRPLEQVEAETSTDHDRLAMVMEGLKERKSAIGRAALENCALQQEEWVNCMKSGSWEDQMQMCRHQVRRLEKCHTMQSRFLRALGYGSVLGRPAEVDEDIQMHADRLYQRVLQHEDAVEQARKDGTSPPVFDPVVPNARAPIQAQPSEDIEQRWRERLEKLPEDERPAEEAALKADYQANTEVARAMREMQDSKTKEREERQAKGKGTFADGVATLFGGFGGGSRGGEKSQ